jgi:hypothetical protein
MEGEALTFDFTADKRALSAVFHFGSVGLSLLGLNPAELARSDAFLIPNYYEKRNWSSKTNGASKEGNMF